MFCSSLGVKLVLKEPQEIGYVSNRSAVICKVFTNELGKALSEQQHSEIFYLSCVHEIWHFHHAPILQRQSQISDMYKNLLYSLQEMSKFMHSGQNLWIRYQSLKLDIESLGCLCFEFSFLADNSRYVAALLFIVMTGLAYA